VTYRARNLPCIFKITSRNADDSLDSILDSHGYAMEAPTSVQVVDLRGRDLSIDTAVTLQSELDVGWLQDFNRLNGVAEQLRGSERRLLEKIVPSHCFASIRIGGRTVAVGLAVAERGYIGLFDIVVDASERNSGLGR
jgi:hypothetical protein